jgi:AcrR family transcriptional regulator
MTTTGRRRGAYAKTAERRREILEACIEVFAASGFRSGSIREIAERAGISQAGVLHHFANKSELLSAVLDLRDERALAFVPTAAGVPGIDTVRGYVALIEHNATVPGLVELHAVVSAEATAQDHPAHAYFTGRDERVVGTLTRAFRDMSASGQLRPGIDPDETARALIALTDGLQLQWLFHPDLVDMAGQLRTYLRQVSTEEF